MNGTNPLRHNEPSFFRNQTTDSACAAGKIVCALVIIAAIGVVVAAGMGWLPTYSVYIGIGMGALGLVALAAVFCCKSKQESASRYQAVDQVGVGEVLPDIRGLSGQRLEGRLEGASSSRPPVHTPPPLSSEKRAEPSRNLLIPFYSGEGRDTKGRTFEDILSFSDSQLESVHNYIQWLFPLSTPSIHNRNAPLLNRELIESMRSSPAIKENILRAFNRMLRFYGLRLESNGSVERADNWEERKRCWVTPHNHNYLRITRILGFMKAMNFHEEAEAFQDQLLTIYTENQHVIGTSTYNFWFQ